MIRKLSLRVQMTIVTTIILTIVASALTITSVYNANRSLVNPFYSMVQVDPMQNNQVIPNYNPIIETPEGLILGQVPNPEIDHSSELIIPEHSFIARDIISSAENTFRWSAIGYMLVIILIGAIIVYYVLGKILNPVKQLSHEIESINEKRLSERLNGFDTSTELQELSHSFNTMLDRLDRAFESQKRFSSDAAHELKTPLTVLKTKLDVLEMDPHLETDDYHHFMMVVKKQTNRMIQLVDNLFILSAQQDYKLEEQVFIDTIFVDILDDLRAQMEQKHLKVEYNPCQATIQSNRIMLTHAFSNLVQNAIKYNHDQGEIIIKTQTSEDHCYIEIIDTGIGIPKEKADYIFDAFYCVDPSRSRRFGGAGLGLAITKDIIDRHEGELEYFPNPKGGSIFKVTLPYK